MNNDGKYIEQLLEKYFEGTTSLDEEKFLRNYFQQDNIPESLKEYKPMFVFFSQEIEKEETFANQQYSENENIVVHNNRKKWMSWIGVGVAACFLLFFGIKFIFEPEKRSPAYSQIYINGKKYTDKQIIQSEALNALENISEGNDDILSSQIDLLESFSK